jgi:hypothetical protein
MKITTIALGAAFVLSGTIAYAQVPRGQPEHPASSSVSSSKRDTTGTTPVVGNESGTSTSGGKDENGDQGRDKMPNSNMTVRQSPGKPDIPNPNRKIK